MADLMTEGASRSSEEASTEQTPANDAPLSPEIGWSFLRSRRWVGYYTLLIIFSIVCVFLGNWQFDRRAEARAEIDRIDTNYDAPAVPLEETLTPGEAFNEDAHKWLTVRMNGTYLDGVYLARNRPGPNSVGSDLMQGFRTDAGSVIFINRGWVDIDAIDIDEATIASLPHGASGEVIVDARLRASEADIDGRTVSGNTIARIVASDLATMAGVTDEAYTQAYGMLVSETPAADHGVLPEKPERDEGPHLSYALQWYVFIIIAAAGVVYAARQEYRGLNAGSAEVRDQDRRRAERKRRRGPTDADEEDALLDEAE